MSASNAETSGQTFSEDDLAQSEPLSSPVSHDYSDDEVLPTADSFDFIVGTTSGISTVNLHAHAEDGTLYTATFKLDVELPSGLVTVTGNSGLQYGNVDPNTGAPSDDPNSGQLGWSFSGQASGVSPITFTASGTSPSHTDGFFFFTQLVNVEERVERASGDFLYLTTQHFVQDGGSYVYQGFSQEVDAGDTSDVPETPIFGSPTLVTDSPRFTPPTTAGDATTRVWVTRSFEIMLMWEDYAPIGGGVPVVISTATWNQTADSAPGSPASDPSGSFTANGDTTLEFPSWIGMISEGMLESHQGSWPLKNNGNNLYVSSETCDLTDGSGDVCYQPVSFQASRLNLPTQAPTVPIIPAELVTDVFWATNKKEKHQ
jgi:hypothetical protein